MRVLYLGSEPPVEWRGASIVMYRLLVQPRDLALLVVSPPVNELFTDVELPKLDESIEIFPFQPHKIIRRLQKTRFYKWGHACEQFFSVSFISRSLMKVIYDFMPDIIIALADNTLSHLAPKLAKMLKIPLGTYFADWTPYYYPALTCTRPILARRWHTLYQKSDVAFCTSDGMHQSLGYHPNAHVIYPLGNLEAIPLDMPNQKEAMCKDKPILMYAGSIQGAYGAMIAKLRLAILQQGLLRLVLYGPCDWSESQKADAIADGSYKGFVPQNKLVNLLSEADFLIVIMSFELNLRFFVETSFTTKFCDYCAYGKPIIIWAPEYCAVVKFAQEHECALIITDPSSQVFCEKIQKFLMDEDKQKQLAFSAKNLYNTKLNPIFIREKFKNELEKLITKNKIEVKK